MDTRLLAAYFCSATRWQRDRRAMRLTSASDRKSPAIDRSNTAEGRRSINEATVAPPLFDSSAVGNCGGDDGGGGGGGEVEAAIAAVSSASNDARSASSSSVLQSTTAHRRGMLAAAHASNTPPFGRRTCTCRNERGK